jgi:hypothetical protein
VAAFLVALAHRARGALDRARQVDAGGDHGVLR